jgi:hypothetical protein
MDARTSKSILILEDEPFIALDHDETAERAGFCAGYYFPHLCSRSAMASIACTFRGSIGCQNVAMLLRNKGIPFVDCSGSSMEDADPAFREGIWVPKPCMPEDLITALTQAKAKVARH